MKALESDVCSDSKLELDNESEKWKKIIYVERNTIVSTTNIQTMKLKELEEGGVSLPLTDADEGFLALIHC